MDEFVYYNSNHTVFRAGLETCVSLDTREPRLSKAADVARSIPQSKVVGRSGSSRLWHKGHLSPEKAGGVVLFES